MWAFCVTLQRTRFSLDVQHRVCDSHSNKFTVYKTKTVLFLLKMLKVIFSFVCCCSPPKPHDIQCLRHDSFIEEPCLKFGVHACWRVEYWAVRRPLGKSKVILVCSEVRPLQNIVPLSWFQGDISTKLLPYTSTVQSFFHRHPIPNHYFC